MSGKSEKPLHAPGAVKRARRLRHDLPEAQLHDVERDAWRKAQGYRVLRIRNRDAFGDADAVAERIAAEIQRSPPSQPFPPSRGKGLTAVSSISCG